MAKAKRRTRRTKRLSYSRLLRGGATAQQVPIGPRLTTFPALLSVTLNDGTKAMGQLVGKAAATPEPQVSWPQEPGLMHTLLCFDPDAPAADWLHWLVANIEGSSPGSGETFVSWAPPAPPSGTHRYFFCLFKHAARVVQPPPKERGYFKTAEFVKAAGLTPVAAAFYRVRAETPN